MCRVVSIIEKLTLAKELPWKNNNGDVIDDCFRVIKLVHDRSARSHDFAAVKVCSPSVHFKASNSEGANIMNLKLM